MPGNRARWVKGGLNQQPRVPAQIAESSLGLQWGQVGWTPQGSLLVAGVLMPSGSPNEDVDGLIKQAARLIHLAQCP